MHGEAGDPAPSALTTFQPGPAVQVFSCIDNAEFQDADLLAASTAVRQAPLLGSLASAPTSRS